MKPDYFSLAKTGLSQEKIAKISGCEDQGMQIRMLRKYRYQLLEEIHEKLSLVMILGLAACGNSASRTEQSSTEENPVESAASMEKSVEGGNTDVENADVSEAQPKNTDVSESQPEETDTSDVQESKVLVAYFSAANTAKGVAEHIANGLSADIYEIVPENPYTDANLNYNDNNSRTTIEMNDPGTRPAIFGSMEDMDQYTTVFIGYPIWRGAHRESSAHLWRAMVFPVKPSFHSPHPEAAAWERQRKGLRKAAPVQLC